LVSSPETRGTGFAAEHKNQMGQWRSVPQPPEGTLVVAVKGNSCCGRNIDSLRQMAKPHFVQMTDRQWQQFISDISLLMKSYTNFAAYGINCGMAFLGLLFMLVMIHACFSLSFGVVTIVGGSFLGCVMARFVTMQMRSENRAIDLEIESVLAQGQLICGGSATFTFDRKSTEVCALCANTELAPEYRALRISPGVQQSMSMQMTVPEGMSGDQLMRIQTMNSMMQVTAVTNPQVLQVDATFQFLMPSMPSAAPIASEVTVDIPCATVAVVGDRFHDVQTAALPVTSVETV
jgi:hypothetical protein